MKEKDEYRPGIDNIDTCERKKLLGNSMAMHFSTVGERVVVKQYH